MGQITVKCGIGVYLKVSPQLNFALYWENTNLTVQNVRLGSLVTAAWCILPLRMEGRLPDTEASCECIE
jgi:hypothetical protein